MKLNKIDKLLMWYFRKRGYSVTITNASNQVPTQKLYVSGSNTIVQPSDRIVITKNEYYEIFSNGNIGI
jgi:hypothetical protein